MTPILYFETHESLTQTCQALLNISRVSETLGYNLAYFTIGIGLASNFPVDVFKRYGFLISILFFAVMFSKMQASIADALHDQDLDAENPEKSFIANSLAHLGDVAYTLLVSEMIIGLLLWSWLTYSTDSLLYIVCGAAITFLRFSTRIRHESRNAASSITSRPRVLTSWE